MTEGKKKPLKAIWALSALAVLLCSCAECGIIHHNKVMRVNDDTLGYPKGKDLWFESQKVDHFDNTNHATWSQRWLANATFWGGNGFPIIVILGGEGTLSYSSVNGHYIVNEWAQELKALIVAVEHRFYGKSIPTNDLSDGNMHLLSSEQGLADFANFITFVKKEYNTPSSKVLSVGGSYSGAMSAWLRQKYPNVVHAAYATSAPVLAQLDFTTYLEIVGQGLGVDCANAIRQGTALYEKLLQTEEGRTRIQKDFNTCTSIETDNDKSTFMEYLADSIATFVQYNNDNNGLLPMNISGLCEMILSDDISVTYPQFIRYYNKQFGESCTSSCYNDEVKALKNVDPNGPEVASRSWFWQTCTEFGFFQTGASDDQPFSSLITLDFFLSTCHDVFGIDSEEVADGVQQTNTYYGGRHTGTTRIVFPNGSVDPWHALSVIQTEELADPAVYIQGTAHCADMYAPSENDIQSLKEARSVIFNLIKKWLNSD